MGLRWELPEGIGILVKGDRSAASHHLRTPCNPRGDMAQASWPQTLWEVMCYLSHPSTVPHDYSLGELRGLMGGGERILSTCMKVSLHNPVPCVMNRKQPAETVTRKELTMDILCILFQSVM